MTTRRGFLGAMLAAAAAPAIVRSSSLMKICVPPELTLSEQSLTEAFVKFRAAERYDFGFTDERAWAVTPTKLIVPVAMFGAAAKIMAPYNGGRAVCLDRFSREAISLDKLVDPKLRA